MLGTTGLNAVKLLRQYFTLFPLKAEYIQPVIQDLLLVNKTEKRNLAAPGLQNLASTELQKVTNVDYILDLVF